MPRLVHKILTANRLADGVVVYLADADRWSEDISAALLAFGAEETAELERAGVAAVASRLVVAPYAIEVDCDGEYVRPLSVRERIRASHRTTLAFHRERETGAAASAVDGTLAATQERAA
ncbi:MAG: DUF2849 domain-containing protein [Hyphomicrobiaceae bacterium]|nr:DUF2849 domain-containing protein [Hyphomicrobiaceae bacterium]